MWVFWWPSWAKQVPCSCWWLEMTVLLEVPFLAVLWSYFCKNCSLRHFRKSPFNQTGEPMWLWGLSPPNLLVLPLLCVVHEHQHWPSPVPGVERTVSEEGLLPILIFLGGREEVVDTNLSLSHVLPRTSCWWPAKLSPRDAALPWLISWLLFWKCSHQSCADQLGQVSASSVYENLESIFLGRGVGDGLGFFFFFGGIWRKGGQWWMLRILII